jgi:hypothetical protein
MAIALRGNLQDFGIAEVFQLIGQQRKTGLLKISAPGREIGLAFDLGSVVWAAPAAKRESEVLGQRLVRCGLITAQQLTSLQAEAQASARTLTAVVLAEQTIRKEELEAIEDLLTNETIFDVLRWTEGSFHFSAQAVKHDKPHEKLLGAEMILMDGLRMVDEWQTFSEIVPSVDTVFEHSGSFEEYRQQTRRDVGGHPEQVERIYQLIDGRLTMQRVADLSRLGIFDATRVIAELIQAGVIAPVEQKLARVVGTGGGHLATMGRGLRWSALACTPLLLLAAGIYFVNAPGIVSPERIQAFPIDRQDLEEARTTFEVRRIRHALETYRYLEGNWPESLGDLELAGLLGSGEMASDRYAAYYYSHNGDNVVLLTPER